MMEKETQKTKPGNKESFFVRKVWLSPIFYIYFLSVLMALGMLYINRENMVNRNSIQPDVAVDSVYNTPIKAQIAKGKQLFKINCSSCHGSDGKGDGPASANLNPKPRDFHSATGWVNGRKVSQMFKTVSEGIPASAMVSFAGALPASDRIAIIDYIRTFASDFPKDSPQDIETMDKTYHLQEGETASSRIPLSEAMKQIEEEAIPIAKNISAMMSEISQHPTDQGSIIFRNVTTDEKRALTMLSASDFWSKNESDFVVIVTTDAVQSGFDAKVAQLSVQDWSTLYNYLKDLFSMKNIMEKNG
jgi:hypothetical protein